MSSGEIVQINISRGGVPKRPVFEAEVGENGIAGDGHNEGLDIHGGPERALCLYAMETIEALNAEGHPITPGSTGENITTRGLDWSEVMPGARFALGSDVVIEITRYCTPCRTIRASFADGNSNRIHHQLHPGWSRAYAKILSGGIIRPGDTISPVAIEDEPERVAGAVWSETAKAFVRPGE